MEYIYIFRTFGRNNKTLVKLGYCKDDTKRLHQHRASNPLLEVVYKFCLADAYNVEQDFHKLHKATYGKEWYEEEMLDAMRAYLLRFDIIDCTNTP